MCDAGCIPSRPFPLEQLQPGCFLSPGRRQNRRPFSKLSLTEQVSPPPLEERDGWTLSDRSGRPMRSQVSAAAPMGDRGWARFPGSQAGRTGPLAAAESPALTLPAAAPATPGGSSGGAVRLHPLLSDSGLGYFPLRRRSLRLRLRRWRGSCLRAESAQVGRPPRGDRPPGAAAAGPWPGDQGRRPPTGRTSPSSVRW